MRSIFIFILISCLFFTSSNYAKNYELISELGNSAEMISLGNIEGFSTDSSGVFENPAALFRVRTLGVSFFTSELMSESKFTLLSMAYRTTKGVFGFGYMSNGITGIPLTGPPGDDGLPVDIGSFSYESKILKAAYAYSHSKYLHFGSTLNYYSTSLHTVSASAIDFDLGLLYKWQKFTVSTIIKNIFGSKVPYQKSDDDNYSGKEILPRWIVFGVQYRLDSVRVMAQLTKRPFHTLSAFGVSYCPSFLKFISLNLGVKQVPILSKTKSITTFGVNFNLYGLKLSNSFQKSDHPDFDNYTYVSIHFDI